MKSKSEKPARRRTGCSGDGGAPSAAAVDAAQASARARAGAGAQERRTMGWMLVGTGVGRNSPRLVMDFVVAAQPRVGRGLQPGGQPRRVLGQIVPPQANGAIEAGRS